MTASPFAPLHLHTWFSLLDGISRPEKVAKRCAVLNYSSCAVTDHGSIGGAVDFAKAMKKEGINPILGSEFYLCRGAASDKSMVNGRPYSHLVVLAKNLNGWQQLVRATSRANSKEYSYYSPRLNLEDFRDFTQSGNLIAFSGHPGSDLGNVIFKEPKKAYRCTSYEELRSDCIHPDAQEKLLSKISQYVSIFGKENFFLEVQMLDPLGMPACKAIAIALRHVAKKVGLKCVATFDSHYVNQEDACDQRVLLASRLKTTLNAIQTRLDNEEEVELGGFFSSNHFHILSPEEMGVHHLPGELEVAGEIAKMCGEYTIFSPPRLPSFPCPNGQSPDDYLRGICRGGLQEKGLVGTSYSDRLEMELGVIKDAGLSPYFLLVWDVVNFGRSQGWLLGPGRGSAAGCLISYTANITQVDPLPYDLIFERFYNAGRNSPGQISLPDIDLDFPVIKRDEVFRYMQRKYGKDKVGRIATYNTLQGRSALDVVLGAHGIGFDDRKVITKLLPDAARIAEELQEMRERGEDPSVIGYALDEMGGELSDWVKKEDDGSLSGEFAVEFAQAIRLEGMKKNLSVHAAGVVISDVPLEEVCPVIYSPEDDSLQAAMEYPALEAMGLVKLDILGIAALNKGEGVRELARMGTI